MVYLVEESLFNSYRVQIFLDQKQSRNGNRTNNINDFLYCHSFIIVIYNNFFDFNNSSLRCKKFTLIIHEIVKLVL